MLCLPASLSCIEGNTQSATSSSVRATAYSAMTEEFTESSDTSNGNSPVSLSWYSQGPDYHVWATAWAQSDFGAQRASSRLDGQAESGATVSVNASSTFQDTWTVRLPTSEAILKMQFTIAGRRSREGEHPYLPYRGIQVSVAYAGSPDSEQIVLFSYNGRIADGSGSYNFPPELEVLQTDGILCHDGEILFVTSTFWTQVAGDWERRRDGSAESDFSGTAVLTSIGFFNQNGDILSGASLTAASGHQYPVHIPEPSPKSFLLAALPCLLTCLARRQQRGGNGVKIGVKP